MNWLRAAETDMTAAEEQPIDGVTCLDGRVASGPTRGDSGAMVKRVMRWRNPWGRVGQVSGGLAVLAMLCSGCGSSEPGAATTVNAGSCGEAPTGLILPFATGHSWTYKVTDLATRSQTQKETTVQGPETVGTGQNKDTPAFKVLTTKKDGTDKTVSWQDLKGDVVVRYREDSYSAGDQVLQETDYWYPYRLHADGTAEHTVKGASWQDRYEETKAPVGAPPSTGTSTVDVWTVLSDSECIDVPAGTGPNGAIEAKRVSGIRFRKVTANNTKEYVYVRGIGKVLEEGTGQTEQLISYKLTP